MASLRTLHPGFRPYAEALYGYARSIDSRFVVTSARRSRAQQYALYVRFVRGLSNLPALPPGRSMHEHGLAFDLARIGVNPKGDRELEHLGAVWRAWGGHWAGTTDPVHFEVPR